MYGRIQKGGPSRWSMMVLQGFCSKLWFWFCVDRGSNISLLSFPVDRCHWKDGYSASEIHDIFSTRSKNHWILLPRAFIFLQYSFLQQGSKHMASIILYVHLFSQSSSSPISMWQLDSLTGATSIVNLATLTLTTNQTELVGCKVLPGGFGRKGTHRPFWTCRGGGAMYRRKAPLLGSK